MLNRDRLTDELLSGHVVEFTCHGVSYLIQEENNKGWDYLGLWRVDDPPACVARAIFDSFDGVDREAVEELLAVPCIGGRSLDALLSGRELNEKG